MADLHTVKRAWTIALSVILLCCPILLVFLSKDVGLAPIRYLLSGRVFDTKRALVTGGAMDQPSLQKEWVVLIFWLMIITSCLAFAKRLNRDNTRRWQNITNTISTLILCQPLCILTIFTYDVSRYLIVMGYTPMRVLGIVMALGALSFIAGFLYWIWLPARQTRQ